MDHEKQAIVDSLASQGHAIILRPGYNPNDDGGREALEMFLHWEEPPSGLDIQPTDDGRWTVIAMGGRP